MQCSVEFPLHLETLIANMPDNHPYTAEQFIINNTLFPYYTIFANEDSKKMIKDYMLGKKVDIYNRITNMINPQLQNQYLRFCPSCNKEALEQYGELYWNRVHQIRGIHICPFPNKPIYNSTVKLNENKYMYVPATAENCIIQEEITYCEEVYQKLFVIAQEALYILNHSNKINIKEQYKNQLKILGYATVNGGLRQK